MTPTGPSNAIYRGLRDKLLLPMDIGVVQEGDARGSPLQKALEVTKTPLLTSPWKSLRDLTNNPSRPRLGASPLQ